MKLGELAKQLDCQAEGDLSIEIHGLAALQEAQPGELSFLEGEKYLPLLKTTRAAALILPPGVPSPDIPCLRSAKPRLAFAHALGIFYPQPRPRPGVHPTAVLGENVCVGENVHLGAHTVIGDDCAIDRDSVIHANCTLYENVRVGARTVIHSNCSLHPNTHIGADCILQSGAVIGGEGFGFAPMADGSWFKMPQTGYVLIEDLVEVGANTTIDRPAVGITRLGRGTKLDNLVMVGHGCEIGEHCMVVGQVGLAGGVKMGCNVVLAGQVGVADHSVIGDRAVITAKTGIAGAVEPGAVLSGYPAIPHHLWMKASILFRRLPELYQILRDLQRGQIDPP